MKLVIGYHGGPSSAAMLDDLGRAGLPRSASALVLTADVPQGDGERLRPSEASALASAGAQRLRALFPLWSVTSAGLTGRAAPVLLAAAERIDADLVVVGASLRRTPVPNPTDVAADLLAAGARSLRICRPSGHPPAEELRILVAYDGTEVSESAVCAVAGRSFSPGTQVRLVAASAAGRAPRASGDALSGRCIDTGSRAGIHTSIAVRRGDPAEAIALEAALWGADAVFVAQQPSQRACDASVANDVFRFAPCTVEVVRVPRLAAVAAPARS